MVIITRDNLVPPIDHSCLSKHSVPYLKVGRAQGINKAGSYALDKGDYLPRPGYHGVLLLQP